jgi:hypothetical protein
LHIANDGERLDDVVVEARFGETGGPLAIDELLTQQMPDLVPEAAADRFDESLWATRVESLAGHRPSRLGTVLIAAPRVSGSHDLIVRLQAGGRLLAENRYTLHVVALPDAPVSVQVIGSSAGLLEALDWVRARVGDAGTGVVAEGCLDEKAGVRIGRLLAAGEVVVVLAQPPAAAPQYPMPVAMQPVETVWGSSVFHFTTDHGALPSLPRRNVLVAEDSTVQAHSVVTRVGDEAFPDTPVVIAYKPVPGSMTGTVVGSHAVGPGRLVFCQYRLCERAAAGDAAARAVLADLLRWASLPRPVLTAEETRLPDGRRVARYCHVRETAR